jgi:hypothetical protein
MISNTLRKPIVLIVCGFIVLLVSLNFGLNKTSALSAKLGRTQSTLNDRHAGTTSSGTWEFQKVGVFHFQGSTPTSVG